MHAAPSSPADLGDAADCWRLLLLGEILRALDLPVRVRDEPPRPLRRTGRWESGVGALRPALDDALGGTAFALAYRWASAEQGRRAWPGALLVAEKAVDREVSAADLPELALALRPAAPVRIHAAPGPVGGRTWLLSGARRLAAVSVDDAGAADWAGVDRTADIAAAWLDLSWSVR